MCRLFWKGKEEEKHTRINTDRRQKGGGETYSSPFREVPLPTTTFAKQESAMHGNSAGRGGGTPETP